MADSRRGQLIIEERTASDAREYAHVSFLARYAMWLTVATLLALGSAATAEGGREVLICSLTAVFTAIGAAFSLRSCLERLGSMALREDGEMRQETHLLSPTSPLIPSSVVAR